MPLPAADITWPPLDLHTYTAQQQRWHAWWAGDPHLLRTAAREAGQDTGRRRFWQRRASADATTATHPMHAPLAADIAQVSADLLFGEPPTFTIPDDAEGGEAARDQAQARLEELDEQLGLANTWLEGAETGAAVGGVYLRPVWDTDVADHPLLTVVPADRAVPDFSYGRLRSVTFYEVLDTPKGGPDAEVWRHLERHERGVIYHGLYVGDYSNLGKRVSLTLHEATAGLDDEVRDHAQATDGLLVSYVPNALPNRLTPHKPFGRSDYDGCESFLDALDECWTSWMRDLRLGQARLVVDTSVTQQAGVGPGAGRTVDLDTELFTEVNLADAQAEKMHQIQFAIRLAEHEGTAAKLTETVVSAAGYSPQTFGLRIEGTAESGTALRLRESKTFRTQGRKQRYWRPAIEHAAHMLLVLDRVIFDRDTPPLRPRLVWPELVDDPAGRAQWINLLSQAQAASIRTRAALAQPDLDDKELDEEVQRIMDEQSMTVAPPDEFGPDPDEPAPSPQPPDGE